MLIKVNFQGFWGDKTFFRVALSAAGSAGLHKHKAAGAWPRAQCSQVIPGIHSEGPAGILAAIKLDPLSLTNWNHPCIPGGFTCSETQELKRFPSMPSSIPGAGVREEHICEKHIWQELGNALAELSRAVV